MQWSKHDAPFLALSFIIVFLLGFFLLIQWHMRKLPVSIETLPSITLYAPSMCLQSAAHREHWEPMIIVRIVEVGERGYRISHWLPRFKLWGEPNYSLTFRRASEAYIPVQCPDIVKEEQA